MDSPGGKGRGGPGAGLVLVALMVVSALVVAGALWLAVELAAPWGSAWAWGLAGLGVATLMWAIRWLWVLVLDHLPTRAQGLRQGAGRKSS